MDCSIGAGELVGMRLGVAAMAMAPAAATGKVSASLCMNCQVRTRCIGGIAAEAGTVQLQGVLTGRRTLRVREVLDRPDEEFDTVYAVRSGALVSVDERDGQVLGFHFPGEVVGADGMASGGQAVSLRAMEDTQVCALRFAPRAGDAAGVRALLSRLWDMVSCELVRERAHQALMATLPPQRRVAAFLASAAARMRGRNPLRLPPGLVGGEIASYLHVSPEAVAAVLESGLPFGRRPGAPS